MIAPAILIGYQETLRGGRLALYNLTADLPGHPGGSTVSGPTLEALGYGLPAEPEGRPA